ncbi:MAG: cell division ATP-binding protein FtsE [Turicibacter sp.]|nr:cell division ATP-binding protein FtsE [Turicibacter sp.]
MIEFINVSKRYPNGVAGLRNMNLRVENGEFVFVIGQSGEGKSTLLKLMTRQEIATSGKVIIDDEDIMKISKFKVHLLRRKVGVVFQDFKLLPKMTVFENVAFALEAIGLADSQVKEKTLRVLEMVGLSEKINDYPNQLSGGEQQRVAIARAIANDPPIIIADEPTGNLDPENSSQIMDILRRLNSEGKTIIMATHNYDLIYEKDCRVIQIKQGTIHQDEVRGYYEA